ncbi:hypothetical protein [Spiroplasma chinense]|uniref:hypothetical protein n=1 Tax=Spiroplasma chinense TaxID=216932 RepID=UPI001412593B|nr:hypothetical protein [Spiroplasma chinense]
MDIKEEQKEIDKKTMKMVDSDLKEVLEMWFNVDLKIIKINKVSESPDKRLAWFCFIEMMTRVVSNVFDENGKCKDVLNSTYLLFKNVRNYTLENVNANNSAKISLIYLNKILRPFLAKWDNLINGK